MIEDTPPTVTIKYDCAFGFTVQQNHTSVGIDVIFSLYMHIRIPVDGVLGIYENMIEILVLLKVF